MNGMLPTLPSENAPEARRFNARDILDAALDGRQPDEAQAAFLMGLEKEEDLRRLQETADELRARQAGESAPFASQVSLLLTNQCELENTLFDYARPPGEKGSYTLTIDDIDERLELAAARQVDQLYVSGGGFSSLMAIPGLESISILKTYARLLDHIRERLPETPIIGFSPDEIEFLRIVSDRSPRYVLELFKDKGGRMLGGQHTYVLDDPIRRRISPRLARVKTWRGIVETAHQLEIPTLGMLGYGHYETPAQRIAHLQTLRELAERHAGIFPLFAPEPIRPATASGLSGPGPSERRRVQAICRIMLGEALPQQQSGWSLHEAATREVQELLGWGGSHLGTTDALAWPSFLAGSREKTALSVEEMEGLVREADRQPKRQAFV